jgi:hypothetical protein
MTDTFAGIIDQLEQRKAAIERALAALREVDVTGSAAEVKPAAAPEASTGKRKKFSAAARRRMALAQKARWAKIKGEIEAVAPPLPEPSKPKSRISPEGMKRIIAATKKRWRLKRAAAKAASAKAAKKVTPVRKAAVKKSTPPTPLALTQSAG